MFIKKFKLFIIPILFFILIDQTVKITISRGFMQYEFDILSGILRFNPVLNTRLSYFGNFIELLSDSFVTILLNVFALGILISGYLLYKRKIEKDIRCPLEYGLEVFGGKWNSRIICVLAAMKILRYSELRKEMGNITDAVLASALKELIANGIVKRQSYDEIPPRVEYSLTEKGQSVVPILQSICHWAGVFYKEDSENEMIQCKKCDYR